MTRATTLPKPGQQGDADVQRAEDVDLELTGNVAIRADSSTAPYRHS